MKWNDIKEFPNGLEKNCYVLFKHNTVLSNSPFEFKIFKYIKTENKVYEEYMREGVFYNMDITDKIWTYVAYTEITDIDYLIFEPYNIVKG